MKVEAMTIGGWSFKIFATSMRLSLAFSLAHISTGSTSNNSKDKKSLGKVKFQHMIMPASSLYMFLLDYLPQHAYKSDVSGQLIFVW